MPRYPWFRVYNEILTERKIERIGRMTHLPRVIIRGAWTTILAMANDSPERGYLMWTDSLWITEAEIADDLEMKQGDFGMLLDAFIKMQMVTRHNGGGLSCTNFDKRQFKSDNSTPRVQAWREKQQAQETDGSNVSETLLCNGPDTDTEADTEADTDTEIPSGADAPNPPPPKKPKRPRAVDVFRENAHRFPAKAWYTTIGDIVGDDPADLERWGCTVFAWVGMGWSPVNVKGMLDCYQKGEIPGENRATGPPGGDGHKTNVQLLEEIREEMHSGDP